MKQIYLPIFCLIVLVVGCQNDMPEVVGKDSEAQTTLLKSKTRTPLEAINIAEDAFEHMYPTSSVSTRGASIPKVKTIITGCKSRSSETDTLMYVVNFPGDNGFAIIPAPSNMEPILGISDCGSYGMEDSDFNPGLELLMERAQIYVMNNVNGAPTNSDSQNGTLNDTCWLKPNPLVREYDYEDTIFRHEVQRRISNAWCYGNGKSTRSENPEGFLFPKHYCGDAVVSIAQLMLYFQYPEWIRPTLPQNSSNASWFIDEIEPDYEEA